MKNAQNIRKTHIILEKLLYILHHIIRGIHNLKDEICDIKIKKK